MPPASREWEQNILETFAHLKYRPKRSFGGETECFSNAEEILAIFPSNMSPRLTPAKKAKLPLPLHCAHCGATEKLTIDHIVARALGGTNERTNLQRLCTACNSAKAVTEYHQTQAIERAAFTQQAQGIHGLRYDYAQVWHPTSGRNVKIQCATHGVFPLTPAAHLAGQGCPQCAKAARKAARQRRHLARFGSRPQTVS